MTNQAEISMSAREAAAAYAKARTKAARAKIVAYVESRAATSKRVRWAKLLEDITKGDVARVKARASGDWAEVNAARKPAKPKASKAKAKAKPKAQAPANDMAALVSQLADLDEVQMAAFFKALTKARA